MTIDASVGLKVDIQQHIDTATQIKSGENIDTLIEEISKTNFENIAEEYHKEKLDRFNNSNIRYWFTVTTLAVSAFAVVCAIASIIFAAGFFTAGAQTLAIVTGFVGVTTAFGIFDKAVYRYLNYDIEEKKKKTMLCKLETKFDNIKSLIQNRMKTLANIRDVQTKVLRAEEILDQIKRINTLIERVKEQVPNKITRFNYVDASPLMQYV